MGGREEYLSLIDGGAVAERIGQLGPEAIGRLLKEPISGSVAERGPAAERVHRSHRCGPPASLLPLLPIICTGR